MSEQTTPLVTAAAVAQACVAIKADGKEPSVRSVRAWLGGGSPNDISPLLTDWKKGVRVIEAPPIQINKAIHDAIAEQIRSTADAAQREATESLAALESDVEELTQAGRVAEARAKFLDAELEVAKGQLQTLAGQIDQLKADADQIKTDAAEQIKATDERASAAVKKAEEEASRERKDREATIASLGEANARLEALPRLETEIVRLQNALDAERKMRTDAERQVAATEAKADGMAARLADTQEQHRQAQVQVKEARDALARATEQLSSAQTARAEDAQSAAARIGSLQGTVGALEKQLTAATTIGLAAVKTTRTTAEKKSPEIPAK